MKKLILSLILLPILAFANEIKEISDKEIKSKFLSVVKDAEVENLLSKTAEFNECRDLNKFDASASPSDKSKKLDDATKCFKDQLAKTKDKAALEKLADNLQLQNYGLIKSKNVNEITDYLSKKMHKSLTGVDSKDEATLKWENRKIVDQKVFIDLYTNQLMKSALFEVSRFCFENLERTDSTGAAVSKAGTDFNTYWDQASLGLTSKSPDTVDISSVSDTGSTSFFKLQDSTDLSKKENIYSDIKKGIASSPISPDFYNTFWSFCQTSIKQLCAEFKKDASVTASQANSATTVSSSMSKGANACLTMNKLQSIRTTMENTQKVSKQFEEMGDEKNAFAIQMIKNPQFYERGKGAGEDSLDKLTSYSSSDMLKDGDGDELGKLKTKCEGQISDDCDDFLVENDSLEKAIHNTETEMNLKRELEVARVNELKDKPDDLKKYLTDNGMFDLLEKLEKYPSYKDKLHEEIGKIYDARKIAEIQSLKLKVGNRQISEKDSEGMEPDDKKQRILDNIKDTREERSRLAQLVMFNNIITSQLKLQDESGNDVGRNVNAWKKEVAGLEQSGGYDEGLFQGLQDSVKGSKELEDTSVVGGGIIDAILGKKD